MRGFKAKRARLGFLSQGAYRTARKKKKQSLPPERKRLLAAQTTWETQHGIRSGGEREEKEMDHART